MTQLKDIPSEIKQQYFAHRTTERHKISIERDSNRKLKRCKLYTATNHKRLPETERREPQRSQIIYFASLISLSLILFLSSVSCVVVHQVRFIVRQNGRTDYALTGESVELSCHYLMKDDLEDVKQVVWSRDGENFLRWRKNKPGLEVLSYTFKGHLDNSSKHSHIIIHNVTIGMHGKYNCTVKTDLGLHTAEHEMVVISRSSCKLNDWRVTSQPSDCRELLKLDCRHMFPRPVPSCGLWNGKSDKFIRSVNVDISEEHRELAATSNKEPATYRVRYVDKFELTNKSAPTQMQTQTTSPNILAPPTALTSSRLQQDLYQYAGHLIFKCDIIVPDTSWRLSLTHRMFDFQDGCNQDPLETIERMRANYSQYASLRLRQAGGYHSSLDDFEMLTSSLKYELLPQAGSDKIELNCWRKPKLGTMATLSCASSSKLVRLTGAKKLVCQPEGWTPVLIGDNQAATFNMHNPTRKQVHDSSATATSIDGFQPTNPMLETENIPFPIEDNTLSYESHRPSMTSDTESLASLSPSQLASLLPRCVTTRRLPAPPPTTNNRLEEARILESHSKSSSSPDSSHHTNSKPQNQEKKYIKLFNFSSSGTSNSLRDQLSWSSSTSLLASFLLITWHCHLIFLSLSR